MKRRKQIVYRNGTKNRMQYRNQLQRFKSAGAFLLILILLPYIVTVFVHGADQDERRMDTPYVKVRTMSLETESGQRNEGKKETEDVVTEVPPEKYFLGILALAVPENSEPEMLKAQAVLTRTKLWQQLAGSENPEEFVFTERYLTPQEMERRWGGEVYEKQYERLKTAIEETENQVLFYGEEYAWVPFHKSSNGMTRSAGEILGTEEYPYLTVKECPLDKEADSEIQIVAFPYREVQKKCQPFLVAVSEEKAEQNLVFEDFEIVSQDGAGYVKELRIGETICSGDEFRDALSLSSSAFSLQDKDGNLQITTTGIGHGLGMSQWTAQAMAKEGKGYEEILQYFFEGTELRSVEMLFG